MTNKNLDIGGWRLVGLVLATMVLTTLLGRFDVFDIVTRSVTGDGERTRMQPMRMGAAECDPHVGERLLETQRELGPTRDGRRRVVFFGNSQQFTASLPRGAEPDESNPAEMASSIFGRSLEREVPGRFEVYTASAPNQTFPEALWQAIYWFHVRPDAPAAIVLQASFDTFRKPGIRAGFRTLLGDEAFVTALERFEAEHPKRAWQDEFTHAKKPIEDQAESNAKPEKSPLEAAIREKLKYWPLFAKREQLKQSFLLALYSARVLALGISPTTRRHIVGRTFDANMEALQDLVQLSRSRGAKVLIYNAPTNPAVSMFYPDEYADYLGRLAQLAEHEGVYFADLGDAVSMANWGYWIDGPDPIHFNREGHAQLAGRLLESFAPVLKADR